MAIPYEVDGDFAVKQRAIVVMEQLRVVLNLAVEVPRRRGKVKDGYEEEEWEEAVKREESGHF